MKIYLNTHLTGEGCFVDMICGHVCRQLDDTYLCGDQIGLTFPFLSFQIFPLARYEKVWEKTEVVDRRLEAASLQHRHRFLPLICLA